MAYNKVNSVDATAEYAKIKGITEAEARNELKNFGLIELIRTDVEKSGNSKRTTHHYDLSKEAKIALQNGKNLVDYLKEKDEKEIRDQKIKGLQFDDLQFKVDKMNQEQVEFWKSQKQRNLQLTLIAIISTLFSLIALMKTWGLL